MSITAGLDVGGAHLKVALVKHGRVTDVRQFACPLWQGLDKLDSALAEAHPLLRGADRVALTMTGELSDLFPDRETGALTLISRLRDAFGPGLRFWMGPSGFGDADAARQQHGNVGSTNFLATAALIGRRAGDALLIDFGSTTADIVAIVGGVARVRGLTDAERQATGELVYTGFTRTAVMGVASAAPFRGQWVSLAREYLATMADVRRILGVDLGEVDQHATADGKGKTVAESVARFARLLGRDANSGTDDDWRIAASHVRETQLRSIHDGAELVLSHSGLEATAPVVVGGIGARDAAEVARRLGRTAVDYGALVGAVPEAQAWATSAAPAVAVALLADG